MILMPRFQKRPLVILGALPLLLAVLSQAASPQEKSSPLLDQADSVLKEMSDLTGLPIKGPLKKEIVGRAEVRKYLVENLHQEMSPHDLHVQEATLQAFGLVSQDFDLENFLIAFYTEQAAGFYDPIRKTMFIADWPPPDQQRLALAHEL